MGFSSSLAQSMKKPVYLLVRIAGPARHSPALFIMNTDLEQMFRGQAHVA
jgi:hypothetical protein